MKARPEFKFGEKITLDKAVALYAERDMRENDDDRGAKSRARNRITNAVKRGELQPATADGRTFLVEVFVSWALLSKVAGKPIKLVDEGWEKSFGGLYEPPPAVVRTFDVESQYQYSDEQRRRAFLDTPIPVPAVEAPQEWVDALAVALCQIDLLRKRNVYLEGRLGKLSKGGKAKRDS